MKFGNMKKVLAVVMAAAMTMGSISAAPPVEVVAAGETPAISAQVALDKKGAKVTWNKLEDATVTGYRVYRTELDAEGNAVGSAQAISTLDAEGNSAKTWKFDFGANKTVTASDGTEENNEISISCLAEGYTSVSEENAYYSQAQGYGFTTGIPTAAGGTIVFKDGSKVTEDVLYGDFATIQPPQGGTLTSTGKLEGDESYMEFVVDVPNGDYKVAATHSGYQYFGYPDRTISVFWFQGVQADRHAVNDGTAVSERAITVTDGKVKIAASSSGSNGTNYPPALSAVTVTEVPKIQTGIDSAGALYCNDVTVDLSKVYTYKVVAMKGDTETADLNSGDIQTIPSPSVSIGETTKNSVKLAINNNELETDSYNIYRKKAADASFTKVAEFTNINAEGNYTASKVFGEKEVYINDDFNSYELGDGTAEKMRNLLVAENGDWTVTNPNAYYAGLVVDKSNADCANNTQFLKKTVLGNYDGAFMFLGMDNDANTTFHKKLADASVLNGQTRLKLNFALPNFSNDGSKDRGVSNVCLYLADKEITDNAATSGYVAKLAYSADDNKIYLNGTEVYSFGEGADAARSVWNTITLDINPAEKTISYEFEREAEAYVKSGNVTIPDVAQEPAAQDGEGEGEPEVKPSATLSFTDGKYNKTRWGSIAIDNLKFVSLGEVDSQARTYTYTDTNLEADTEYNYYVGAVVDGKEVVKSSTVSAKTQPIPVDSISLNPSTPIEMKKGDTIDVPEVIVSPDNASDPSVAWSSDDPTVATVVDGKIEGKSAGTTNIVATTKNNKKASCAVTVTAVSLNRASLGLKIGDGAKLTATVAPASITNKSVTWKSDDENIATVDQEGNVKAIAVGRTKITVTAANNGETATCTVNVSKVDVTGITLNPTSGTVKKGATVTLSAKVAPDNATNKDLTWKSSNEKVATVANGVVKAVGKGTATITVTSVDNPSVTATYKITVTEDPVKIPATAVNVKSTKITLDLSVKSKKTAKISASLTPSNSTDSITYSLSSKDKKIIKVDGSGKITALKAGSAKVTVKSTSGKTKTVNVTVKASATKVKIKGKGIKKNKVTLKKGKKLALTATISPKNSTDKAKWTTSKKKYVTIKKTKKGVTITAKKKGKSVITVKAGKKSAKITVTVK